MPQSVLSEERLRATLGVPVTPEQLDDLLFVSKAEVNGREGDALTISVTPDRLDLLSETGLALYLAGMVDAAHGLPRFSELALPAGAEFRVDRSVVPLRPYLAGVVVRAPADRTLDAGTLSEAIRFQELLHATVGRDRRAASLGIYPWEKLTPPIRYSLEPLSDVRFVPLDGPEEVFALDFFATHPLAERYGAFGRTGDRCLVLRDAAGSVLSLPPVLNSRSTGEARIGDRALLLESTGTSERVVRETLGLLLVVFAGRGWSVAPMSVVGPGDARSDGRSVLSPPPVDLPSALVGEVGGEALPAPEVERRLGRARLSARPHPGGWRVGAPPWRPDLLAAVDVVEDVLLAVPIRPEDGTVSPSYTQGRRRPETVFRRRVATDLLGLGFTAPHTSLLVPAARVESLGDPAPIRIRNPVSLELAYLRHRLFLSHIEVLAHNTRHGYPQRFAEVGPVVVRAPASEPGAESRYHAGLLLASESAGFAEVAALVDYLLRRHDLLGVREPAELPGLIPGRTARVRVAGEVVAELGELVPNLLAEIGVPVPTAYAEVDLSALWPLLGGREAL